jgi:hypothetical protein
MRGLKVFAIGLVLGLLLVPAAFAQPAVSPNDPTSSELVSEPKKWDGKEITFTGEAITEAQERGDFAWIHLNDDAYYLKNIEEGAPLGGYNSGHAVWVPTELTEQITYYGDFKHEGDVVEVVGTFNAACAQHGGDMDIHAQGLRVVAEGRPVVEAIHPTKMIAAGLLIAVGIALGWASRRAQHLDTFGSLAKRARSRS